MPTTIHVSTRAELVAALQAAQGGEQILLRPGNYGSLSLITRGSVDMNFGRTVTVKAADPKNPPVINKLDIRGASNLHFENITFDYQFRNGDPLHEKPFHVMNGNNISFSHSSFKGDVAQNMTAADNGYPTGFALHVRNSNNVNVTDNVIEGFYRGIVVNNGNDITVARNELHSLRMDGLNFGESQRVLIEDNYIHDFNRSINSVDHADMIQFWTRGTSRPSTDIVIRNNKLDSGDGHATQSIFMRNELVDQGAAGAEMYYQNVLIEGNVILNGDSHGITVGATRGLTIRGNSVLHSDGATPDGRDSSVEIPRIKIAVTARNVFVAQNATAEIDGYRGQNSWALADNAIVQDQNPNAAGWYGDIFYASTMTGDMSAGRYVAMPGSILDVLQAGAPATLNNTLNAGFSASTVGTDPHTVLLDASAIAANHPPGTTFTWHLPGLAPLSGPRQIHRFSESGEHDVRLLVQTPSGAQYWSDATVAVQSSEVLAMTQHGVFVADQAGKTVIVQTDATLDRDGGIQLGGPGITASIDRDLLTPIFSQGNVSFSFRLDADRVGASGEVFRIHGALIVSVESDGSVKVRANSSSGEYVILRSTGTSVNDRASHQVEVRLKDGQLSLLVNGRAQDSSAFSGHYADTSRLDLTFGNAWHDSFFQGDLTAFSVNLHNDAMNLDPADPYYDQGDYLM